MELALPDDWHVHLRDDDLLAAVAPLTARTFRYALVMPNLVPPISSTAQARAYRQRIIDGAGEGALSEFQPLMTAYLNEQLDAGDLRRGYEEAVLFAVKYYPAGATTNSEHGGRALSDHRRLLELMAELGMPLLVHAESTDPSIDIYDREAAFLEHELAPLAGQLPELRITVEHLSTRAGVDLVSAQPNLRGSITPHHLSCDRSDLLANGLRPDLYCKPIINSAADREALVAAATSGSPDFFLGTDSAPHPSAHKYTEQVRPGIFNAPYALPVVAEVFHRAGALDRLEQFTSINGCCHYGFEPATARLRLRRHDTDTACAGTAGTADTDSACGPADNVATPDGSTVRIFGVAEARRWTVDKVPAPVVAALSR
jgi:dihydroorotase